MKRTLIVLSLAIVFILHSCIPSIHPLYTEDILVFKEALIGVWNEDDNATWTLRQAGDKPHYELTYADADERSVFDAHLVKLGEHYFFDFYNTSSEWDNKDALAIAPLIPTHSFAKVSWDEGKMTMYFFDVDWLGELFKQRKIRIKHEVSQDGNIILTASTEELQEFVRKYADDEKAYIDPLVLKR